MKEIMMSTITSLPGEISARRPRSLVVSGYNFCVTNIIDGTAFYFIKSLLRVYLSALLLSEYKAPCISRASLV